MISSPLAHLLLKEKTNNHMSKLIVTGGAGFIGSHLTDELIALGHEVVVVDNLMLGKKEFVNAKADFQELDIRNLDDLKKVFAGAEAVFHLAADPRLPVSIEDPVGAHEINVTGTLNVLEAARKTGVKKVIFSSSCAAYGDQKLPIKENVTMSPKDPYGTHKLMGEQYCRLFNQLFGLETVCLRYFNVYGPRKLNTGSYPMVIPVFLGQKKSGEPLTITGDGETTRDYVHVSDVVNANILAWQSSVVDGTAINVGTGIQTSVNEIANLVGGEAIHVAERPGEMRKAEADIKRANELLGWVPKTLLKDGMAMLKKEWGL